jgi:glycosyltransferase involved in cell wall biosynthesis
MRVLLLNDYGTATGGAEFQILALREGLRRRGYDARLLTSSVQYAGSEVVADYQCFGTTSRLQPLVMAANPSAAWRLRRVLLEFRPHVVHVQMFMWQLSPLILPLLNDIPSVHHVQMYNAICPLGTKMLPDGTSCRVPAGGVCFRSRCFSFQAWVAVMLQRRLWRRWGGVFTVIVAISEAVKERLQSEGIAVAEVIGNGVPIRPARGGPLSTTPLVAFAGRLVREKGADLLLEAFARVATQIPGAKLVIAGDGPERARLQALTADLGVTSAVEMLGHVSRDELQRRLSTAWVQAVPGRWEEPFGMVTAEAMMRGTAVVASASGGTVEIVQDGVTGLLVSPGDTAALAAALGSLLRDRVLAERMGAAGREIALQRFSESISVERFVTLYERLLSEAGRR